MKVFSSIFFSLLILNNVNGWIWTCHQKTTTCSRLLQQTETNIPKFPTLQLCQLYCDPAGLLWPKPTQKILLGKDVVKFSSRATFEIVANGPAEQFLKYTANYFDNLVGYQQLNNCTTSQNIVVKIGVLNSDVTLDSKTDESYILNIITDGSNVKVEIVGTTVFGARHGIETLLQLITPYPDATGTCLSIVNTASITDKPVYKHRGLLLDSARNFLPIDAIKRNIDALAASKMNVLHWHVTDSQSWPLEIKTLPNMTLYGAYSNKKVYLIEEVLDLVEYARRRGVRIIPEIDGPSHAGSGFEWGAKAGLGNLVVCANQQPWRSFCIQPPCGQMNPANDKLYPVLGKIFQEVFNMFQNKEMFHMGGDEVYFPCWNSSQEIIDYLGNKPRTEETFIDLWGEHQLKVLNRYDATVGNQKTTMILWTSHLTQPELIEEYLDKNRYIIQTWVPKSDPLPDLLLSKGYKLIISTKDAWYLDHGFWGTTSYSDWKQVYDNTILTGEKVLGGEVCMWGELVDGWNVEGRTWPRAAAAAERLWTNPSTSSRDAETRFVLHRERLVERGVKADGVTPGWCVQNPEQCR